MDTLYESIKALCEERGIKPGKMCVDLDISKSMMTKLKNGSKQSIQVETAQKIANYFGVSVDRVLGTEEKPADDTISGLSEYERKFIEWFRSSRATEKDKALVRMIVEGTEE